MPDFDTMVLKLNVLKNVPQYPGYPGNQIFMTEVVNMSRYMEKVLTIFCTSICVWLGHTAHALPSSKRFNQYILHLLRAMSPWSIA